MPPPWLGILMMVGAFAGLMSLLDLWRRRFHPSGESLRKAVHVGMGTVSLGMPWLFADAAPVLVLAGVFAIVLSAIRMHPGLRRRFGGIIDAPGADRRGELYFVAGVAAAFVLSAGDAVAWWSAMLALTFADSAAAWVGGTWGTHAYSSCGGSRKTWEGSAAFVFVAFVGSLVAMLAGGMGTEHALTAAAALALMTMLLEGFAPPGSDNLLIPVGAAILATAYSGLDADALRLRVPAALLLAAFAKWK